MNWRSIDGTFKEYKGKLMEQIGKMLSDRSLEENGKAVATRGRIQKAASNEARLQVVKNRDSAT